MRADWMRGGAPRGPYGSAGLSCAFLSGAASRPWAIGVGIVVFAALTALGARITVPVAIGPVPITLQTLAVFLSGLLLGARAGAASQLLYLALGTMGLPIFSLGGGSLAWLFGPTGGYLMAFPLAAAAAGSIGRTARGTSLAALGLAAIGLLLATIVIFTLGALWLGASAGLSAREAFIAGVSPFLLGEALKIAAALMVLLAARGRI